MTTMQEHTGVAASQSTTAAPSGDFPYEGAWAGTRVEPIHLPMPGGSVEAVQAYRVVNVSTDPHLAEAALSGTLRAVQTLQPNTGKSA